MEKNDVIAEQANRKARREAEQFDIQGFVSRAVIATIVAREKTARRRKKNKVAKRSRKINRP